MIIAVKKSFAMHVQEAADLGKPTDEDYARAEGKVLLEWKCENCSMAFTCKKGKKAHPHFGHCRLGDDETSEAYEVEQVLQVRGSL